MLYYKALLIAGLVLSALGIFLSQTHDPEIVIVIVVLLMIVVGAMDAIHHREMMRIFGRKEKFDKTLPEEPREHETVLTTISDLTKDFK